MKYENVWAVTIPEKLERFNAWIHSSMNHKNNQHCCDDPANQKSSKRAWNVNPLHIGDWKELEGMWGQAFERGGEEEERNRRLGDIQATRSPYMLARLQ